MIDELLHHLHRHTIGRIQNFVRCGTFRARSPKFRALCEQLEASPDYKGCIACGTKEEVEWHHWQVEFHQDPSRELDPSNLVPLCMKRHDHGTPYEHHLRVGHNGNWKTLNPNVLKDAAAIRATIKM